MSQSHITSQEGSAVGAQIFSLTKAREERKARDVYARWVAYYGKLEHQDLLDALVYEHDNNFPLRSSGDPLDHLRHKALIQVLQERAHSDFLKNLLSEMHSE